jgi:hypothetical protein
VTLGPQSLVVNGQLVDVPTQAAYAPLNYGQQTMGVPMVTPSYPPQLGTPTQVAPGSESVGGYGTAGNNSLAATLANAHPFNLKMSPTIWAVGGLIVGLILLKAVSWRETMEEHTALGPMSEEARESA